MKWIPLSERKPDIPYTSNIIFAKEGYIIGSYSVLQPNDATHWMYLDPPKTEKPKDPDWEKLQSSFDEWDMTSLGSVSTYDLVEEIFYFLKAKYGK